MTTRTIEKKEGRKWTVTFTCSDEQTCLRNLASELAAKYVGKAEYVRSIKRRNNHDGTQTYTVTFNNDHRAVYVTDIY